MWASSHRVLEASVSVRHPMTFSDLLIEQWRRAIIKEKVAAKQRRLVIAASLVCPSSLDEITIVTRIGRLRLPRNLSGTT